MTQEKAIEIPVEEPNSVEISINNKGQYSGKVKVYARTIDSAYDQALQKAQRLEALIAEKNAKK